MKILVDIVHPADVLFFYNPITKLEAYGHRVVVQSRDKDVTLALLDGLGIEHSVASTAGKGLAGLARELIARDHAVFRCARRERPDLLLGFGGVAISHVGRVLRIPSVSFYDTARAPLQNALSLPFLSRLYVPESYDGPTAPGRTRRFPGSKELSYLHPENFTPDLECARAAGLARDTETFLVRRVDWSANHDIGYAGWPETTLRAVVRRLQQRGQVIISSEAPLPDDLQHLAYAGAVQHLHHLLAFCSACVGESATLASEASALGVPAIYAAASDRRCYTDALAAKGLLWTVHSDSVEQPLLGAIDHLRTLDAPAWQARTRDYWRTQPNLSDFIVGVALDFDPEPPGDGMP